MSIRVLLSSFEPFGTHALNSSFEVGRLLAAQSLPGIDLEWLVLPVVVWECVERAWERIGVVRPDLVLALGQRAGAAMLQLERVAVNLNDFSMTDNAGNLLCKQPIVPD